MKRTWPALLGLLLLAAPAAAQAQFSYTTNADGVTLTITGYYAPAGPVTIPTNIDGLTVVSIGDRAFTVEDKNRHIYPNYVPTSVTIPGSVTNIGTSAFESCEALTNVAMANGVTSVGNFAFNYCTGLSSLTIGRSVATIGDGAFYYCTNLASVSIPDSVTNLGPYAFAFCSSVTAITVDAQNLFFSSTNGVLFDKNQTTLIQYPGAVGGSYAIPGGVTTIGDAAFGGCAGLTNVTVPPSVTSVGDSAFDDCSSLTNITIPGSVSSVGVFAFDFCTSLKSLTIPASVTSIGDEAFYYCTNLRSVLFEGNAPAAGLDVFDSDSLVTVYFLQGTIGWSASFGGLHPVLWNPAHVAEFNYATNSDGLTLAITGYSGPVGPVTIPSTLNELTVVNIGDRAFATEDQNSNILPNYVPTSVTIPGSVTNIGDQAFYWCVSLTNITMAHGLASIGDAAFGGCQSLSSVLIPDSVTTIGQQVFTGCFNLTAITVDEQNQFYSGVNGALLDKSQSAFLECPNDISGSYTVPRSVTDIGDYAFATCQYLGSVIIPGGVTNIGSDAFENCSNLGSVHFEGNAPAVGSNVFDGDSLVTVYYTIGTTGWSNSLAGVQAVPWNPSNLADFYYTTNATAITIIAYIGAGGAVPIPFAITGLPVTSIGADAFYGATKLTSVTIPASVTSIGDGAFSGCSGLTNVTIPASATSIGDDAFLGCSGLTNVTIPGSVTSIGDDSFLGCGLTSVTISNGVASIGNAAFGGCAGLTNVTIPASVTTIGEQAFMGCSNLRAITVDTQNPIYSSMEGVLFDKSHSTLVEWPGGWGEGYSIPSSVTRVADYAFAACQNLGIVIIPGSVANIGEGAFTKCTGLTDVVMYYGVTTIGAYAFSHTSLAGVTLPGSVTSLGDGAFASCSSLSSVHFGGSSPAVGLSVFDADASATIYYYIDTFGWSSPFAGLPALALPAPFSCMTNADNTITITGYGGPAGPVTIPSSIHGLPVSGIGYRAFLNNNNVTRVAIPGSVTGIGPEAFYATGLTNAAISGSVTNIGDAAFSYCDYLASVFFGGNAPTVSPTAFSHDLSLTIYYLPGTTGWGEFAAITGVPTALWNPVILTRDGSFGVRGNQFGFYIFGTANIPIVVEACTNLASPVWTPLATLTLNNGLFYFSEPLQTNSAGRYYRIRSP